MVVINDNKRERMQTSGGKILEMNYGLSKDFSVALDPKEDYLQYGRTAFVNRSVSKSKSLLALAKTPRTLLQAGDAYLLRNNPKRANRYYLEALEIDPEFIPAYEKIVLIYSKYKESRPKALLFYHKLLSLTNRRIATLHSYAMFRATIYSENNGVDEAIDCLNEVLEVDKKNFEVMNSLGFLLMNLRGDFDNAKKYIERSREIKSDYVHSTNNLGVVYQKEGNLDKAASLFKEAIKTLPTYLEGYQNLALLYLIQKKYDLGLEVILQAKSNGLVLHPEWEFKIGWFLIKLERSEEAIVWYEQKIKEEPQNIVLHNNLGIAFKQLGRRVEAKASFEKVYNRLKTDILLSRDTNYEYIKSLYNLGRMAADEKRFGDLKEIIHYIGILNRTDAYGFYFSGVISTAEGRYEKAKEYFAESQKISDKIPEVYPDYAFVLECIDKDYEGAISLLEKGIGYNFKSPIVDNNLAYAYIKNNQKEEAERILEAYNSKELPGMILATKGMLEFRKDNFDKAEAYYQRATKIITGVNLEILIQVWSYEKLFYFLRNGDFATAKKEIEYLKEREMTYMTSEILDLINNYKNKL